MISKEGVDAARLMDEISCGRVVVVPNRSSGEAVGIGDLVSSKVICNLGTSSQSPRIAEEIEKAKIAIRHGASVICDQSVGENVADSRKQLLAAISVPLAAVPLYQNVDDSKRRTGEPLKFDPDEVLTVFEGQIASGVDMPGIHSMSLKTAKLLADSDRLMPMVSRGAGLMYE